MPRMLLPAAVISLTGLVFLGKAIAAPPAGTPSVTPIAPQNVAFFEQNIRPLLAQRCYGCHGGKSGAAQGGLRLDTRAGWMQGGAGGTVIVPGDPDQSRLIKAVLGKPGISSMPPGGKLPDKEATLLVEWVKRGAPDPRDGSVPAPRSKTIDIAQGRRHWAFQPLKRSLPPTPLLAAQRARRGEPVVAIPKGEGSKRKNAGKNIQNNAIGDTRQSLDWMRGSIDRFLLAKMQQAGLAPNSQADKRTLIRRAYFDVIGLPPTPQEVDAFVNDKSPNAWEKVVDGLLASPHYGERWGRHWLDLARFAESHGYEQDYDRPYAYFYRDFVIKALNQDMPFNQFVQWQLAGDEIAPENPLALMATGFLGAGTHATQITKNQVEKERYDELDDMTATTGVAMLGLTVGCARCHNHKYDPIPNQDYYRLLSTFTTTVRSDMDVNMDPAGYRQAKAKWEAEHAPIEAELARYEREQLPQSLETWIASPARHSLPAAWSLPEIVSVKSSGGATFTPQHDGSLLVSGNNSDFDTYTFVTRTSLKHITGLRLEALADPSMVGGGPGRAPNGNFALTAVRVTVAPANAPMSTVRFKLLHSRATFEQKGLPISSVTDDSPKSAWAVDPQFGKDHAASFELAAPVGFEGGTLVTCTLKFENNTGHNIGRPRLSLTDADPKAMLGLTDPARPAEVTRLLAALDAGQTALNAADLQTLSGWYRTIDPEWQMRNQRVKDHLAAAPQPKMQKMLVCSEGVTAIRTHTQGGDNFEQTYFLKRGDPNQKDGVATQSFLQVLMRTPEGEKRWQTAPPSGWHTSYRRRSLANWITDVDYGAGALLARVIVNRLWQHHFGRGLVATPSDFGTQGAPPTHPELLDWLASELLKNNWQLKPLHKLMLCSAAYRQTSLPDPRKSKLDPDNKLVARHIRQRVEAEILRDSLLDVSGLLDTTMYGPGTLDESMKRRSIYFTIKRSRLIPSLRLFDGPDALQSIGARQTTTVAPQALMLLNNLNVREYAAKLAQRVASTDQTPRTDAIRNTYLLTLSRPPTVQETSDALAFLAQQSASYQTSKQDNPASLALTDFCQALMSSNEFVYVE